MSQRYIDNTKRPKPKENQVGTLKIYAFYQKIEQRALNPGVIGVIGVTYLSMRIHQKSCCIFPQNVAATLLSGSRKGAVGAQQSHSQGRCRGYMLKLQALTYIKGNERTSRHIWKLCHRNPEILERMLNRITLSNHLRQTTHPCKL